MYVEADVNPDAERIMTMEDDEPSEPVAEPSDPFAAAAAEHEEIPLLENEMDDLGDLPLAGDPDLEQLEQVKKDSGPVPRAKWDSDSTEEHHFIRSAPSKVKAFSQKTLRISTVRISPTPL